MRGIAAAIIVVYHFRDQFGPAINLDPVSPFFSRSYLLVDFFFVLSGYVISLAYAKIFEAGIRQADYIGFLIKRLARIYPLHIIVLAAFVLSETAKYAVPTAAYPPFSVNTWASLIANVLLVQSWGILDHYTWNHPAWSISTEWFAYLIFPLLTVAVARVRNVATSVLLIIGLFIAVQLVVRIGGTDTINVPVNLQLLRCLPSFALGMFAHRLVTVLPRSGAAVLGSDVAFAGSLLAACLSLVTVIPSVLVICAFFFAVLTGSQNQGRVSRALSVKPLYFLGEISYSVYLVHTLIQRIWQMLFQVVWHSHITPMTAWISFVVLFIVVIVASTLSFYLVEKPGRFFFGRVAFSHQPIPVLP